MGFLSGEEAFIPEHARLSCTRLFLAHAGKVYGATLGVSGTGKVEEVGSRYMLELLAAIESPLSPRFARRGELGFRFLFPNDIMGEGSMFPFMEFGGSLGLSWNAGGWRPFVEASLFFPGTWGARAGLGYAF